MPLAPHFSEPATRITLPRPVMAGAALLAFCVIAFAGVARRTGFGREAAPVSVPLQARSLAFLDRSDGGVDVVDPVTHRAVTELPPGNGGFVRGILRALVRERRAFGPVAGPPFVLTRWRDGRLTLDDPATRRRLELTSFGSDNAAVFDGLLTRAER